MRRTILLLCLSAALAVLLTGCFFRAVDDLYAEVAHFVGLLLAGETESPVMPLATSLRCTELLAAVRARMGSGPQPSPAV